MPSETGQDKALRSHLTPSPSDRPLALPEGADAQAGLLADFLGGALDAKLTAQDENEVADQVEQPEIGLGVDRPARKLGLGEELAARFAIA